MSDDKSYRQILRSSSIMGGAQGLNYLVSFVRIKMVALLLGPAGVGLVSLYSSTLGLLGTLSGLGLGSSGVREVAHAVHQQDEAAVARTVLILRRVCWVTGLAGWALAVVLAAPLSIWISGSTGHTVAIVVLGCTLLLGAINNGQTALLQGMRRIGDIARINVTQMVINTGVAIGLYSWLGQRGIIPVLVMTAAVSLGVSWWFTRRVCVAAVSLSWPETFKGAGRLAGLGIAFMWSGILTTGLDMSTRVLVSRLNGVNAAGLYQAAWALSGLFANFILSAMGTDFYPRLTGVIHDHSLAGRTVNEQIEVGMLLALPGLLGTLAFAPWLMTIFYSKQFSAAAALLPWFILGVLGRVISWPLGFIMLAKGASRWFAITEAASVGLQIGLLLYMLPRFGVIGVSYTFAITYAAYTLAMLPLSRRLIGFRLSTGVKNLMVKGSIVTVVGIIAETVVSGWQGSTIGGVAALGGTIISLRELSERLGANHPVFEKLYRIPGCQMLLSKRWKVGN